MKKLYASFFISVLLLLNACSDYADDIKEEYQERLKTGFIECDKDIEGTQVSTIDGGDRICKDGSWNPVVSDYPKSSSSFVQESSSSAISALYLCPDGSLSIDHESCEKKECKNYSGDLICLEDIVKTLGECTEDIEDSIGLVSETYFICRDTAWFEADTFEIDTYHWESAKDGDVKYGNIYKTRCYVFDTSSTYNGWRKGEFIDCQLYAGGCTQSKAGLTIKNDVGNYYSCQSNLWTKISDDIGKDTWTEKCDIDGKTMYGLVHTSDLYLCDNNLWRLAEPAEYTYGLCSKKREGVFSEDKLKYCTGTEWKTTTEVERAIGEICSFNKLNKYVSLNDKSEAYVCTLNCSENCTQYIWRVASCAERAAQSICNESIAKNENNSVTCADDGKTYICKQNNWVVKKFFDYNFSNISFFNPNVTYGTLIDDRDNHSYKTITIANSNYEAEWMAENLQYSDSISNDYLKEQSWCYNNEEKNCSLIGRLYSWGAAMSINQKYTAKENVLWAVESIGNMIKDTHQGICPTGWHIPSYQEWESLYLTFNNNLASLQTQNNPTHKNATNESGFSLVPGIYNHYVYDNSQTFFEIDNRFWAKTGHINLTTHVETILNTTEQSGFLYDDSPKTGLPIRCVKNCDNCKILDSLLVDKRDGHTYKIVIIGKKVWMAENLNYAYNQPTSSLDSSSFCYDNKIENCKIYGRLYLWSAATDSAAIFSKNGEDCGHNSACETTEKIRGVCPEGWHIPNEEEIDSLFSEGSNYEYSTNQGVFTNSRLGFNALLAGYRNNDGTYGGLLQNTGFFISSKNPPHASIFEINHNSSYVGTSIQQAKSVRCVKD